MRGDAAAAQRVLRRECLSHLPGRLDRLRCGKALQPAATDVGKRFPAQRFHLALEPGDPGEAHGRPYDAGKELDSAGECSGALWLDGCLECALDDGLRVSAVGSNVRILKC